MIFGHQANAPTDFSSNSSAPADDSAAPQMTPPTDLPATSDDLQSGSVLDQPSGSPDLSTPTPMSTALSDESSVSPTPTSSPSDDTPAQDVPSPAPGNDDLLSLKQQALDQLSPLVGQLDQSPEEKFRTTMMMLQSTDNQTLLKDAFDAAQAISDDKVRAQALLDVINEINYFTQKG